MGGSLGCQIWYPTTWEQMTLNFSFIYKPVYGTYTVNRELFGDGTNKKNNWMDENWWKNEKKSISSNSYVIVIKFY